MTKENAYLEYVKEREGVSVLEWPEAIALIRPLKAENMLYLQDVFVLPAFRKQGIGRQIVLEADKIAKELGYKAVLTSVSPPAKGSHESMTAILRCDFKLHSCIQDLIYFIRECK